MKFSQKRHILKTITWRIIASTTTFVLAMIFFRDDPDATQKATGVAITETFLKMIFYYLHERVWDNTKLSKSEQNVN